ncbi:MULTISPECIES: hypothetical protein [Bacillus cereus group]|nr:MULTISPECIES: hypothetical protein [Bacillus cereus group]MED2795873.1 hypothetical protein [Bacillus wiedmannii]
MTMIMSICRPYYKIIVPRNLHKLILSVIIFTDAKVVVEAEAIF